MMGLIISVLHPNKSRVLFPTARCVLASDVVPVAPATSKLESTFLSLAEMEKGARGLRVRAYRAESSEMPNKRSINGCAIKILLFVDNGLHDVTQETSGSQKNWVYWATEALFIH